MSSVRNFVFHEQLLIVKILDLVSESEFLTASEYEAVACTAPALHSTLIWRPFWRDQFTANIRHGLVAPISG